MKKVLLNFTVCLICVSVNAQNQESFTDIVKEYKNEIENVMTAAAPYNIEKERNICYKNKNFNTDEWISKEFYCMMAFSRYFIASGEKYYIGRNPPENVTMTISFVNPQGKRKIKKKKIKDVTKYLCKEEIPADSIKVTSIQVFKIIDIAESDEHSTRLFKKNILSIDGCSIFDIDEEGHITEKNETPCNFTILHTGDLASWQIERNLDNCDASPLFGNIEVTIWTKK